MSRFLIVHWDDSEPDHTFIPQIMQRFDSLDEARGYLITMKAYASCSPLATSSFYGDEENIIANNTQFREVVKRDEINNASLSIKINCGWSEYEEHYLIVEERTFYDKHGLSEFDPIAHNSTDSTPHPNVISLFSTTDSGATGRSRTSSVVRWDEYRDGDVYDP